MKLNGIHVFVLILFAVLLIKWTEGYQKTTALNIHGVQDIPESNPSVYLRPLKEKFNFFARDADIVLRGRYINVNKINPDIENRSALAMKSEENRLRFEGD